MINKNDIVSRQNAIKELLTKKIISDQKQLVALLKENYKIETNQAVVSRDIRKLGVVKKMINGVLTYEMPDINVSTEIVRLALVDIVHNESIIVIKTHPGLADYVGDSIDDCPDLEILGCLSGENVVFVTPKSTKNIHTIYKKICEKFQFKKKEDL